jgi:hypothetical protein
LGGCIVAFNFEEILNYHDNAQEETSLSILPRATETLS